MGKNGSFANKTGFGLTALFVKTKFTFIIVILQIKKQAKIPSFIFSYKVKSIHETQNIPKNVSSFGNGAPN